MNTLYLVSCVSKKKDKACPARDLYISDWFRKARAYVELTGHPWFILSAEYGLVNPETVIEPYERTLNKMPVRERRAWAERVIAQLQGELSGVDRIVILAGARYREFIMEGLSNMVSEVEVPLEGLRIGEQLSWLLGKARHEQTR